MKEDKPQEDEKWTIVITPKRGLIDINIRELIAYRDLLFMLVKRDFIIQYKQTVIGPAWLVISPLIAAFVYTFVFGNLADIGTDGIPHVLFYYSGILLWNFFADCFNKSAPIFNENANLWSRIYFPRLVVPIGYFFSSGMKALIQLCLLAAFFIYYFSIGVPLYPSWRLLLFPMLLVWLWSVGVGMGLFLSAISAKYRDIRIFISYIFGLAMYAAPVVFPLSEIPEQFLLVAYINPVTAPIELFRQWFFGFSSVSGSMILVNLGITSVFLAGGLIVFNQAEATFVDVI